MLSLIWTHVDALAALEPIVGVVNVVWPDSRMRQATAKSQAETYDVFNAKDNSDQ